MSTMTDDRMAKLVLEHAETSTLSEVLAIDSVQLMRSVFPQAASTLTREFEAIAHLGISARMAKAGAILLDQFGPGGIAALANHSSDTVRGWACFMIGAQEMPLAGRLDAIRPFADDTHFGVREWAWLAVRPAIAADLPVAISALIPWTGDASPRVRRFATEATRPRGVWCKHIDSLKADPEPGRALLDPLRGDETVYVQDSVSNWLNDAAKSRPDWVQALVSEWVEHSPCPATQRIARRALRSVKK